MSDPWKYSSDENQAKSQSDCFAVFPNVCRFLGGIRDFLFPRRGATTTTKHPQQPNAPFSSSSSSSTRQPEPELPLSLAGSAPPEWTNQVLTAIQEFNANPSTRNSSEKANQEVGDEFVRYFGEIDNENHRQAQQSKSILVDASVTEIPNFAFANCSAVERVVFESGTKLERIGEWAFANTPISSMNLPSSVTTIGKGAFLECKKLTNVHVVHDFETSKLATIGERAFQESSLSFMDIPPSVEIIGTAAFFRCERLAIVNIHHIETSRLARIDDGAFQQTGLSFMDVPSSVKIIGNFCFFKCQRLTHVKFHDFENSKLEMLGEGAFYKTSLPSAFHFPPSAMVLGKD